MDEPTERPPTEEQYGAYQRAWAYFNAKLFGGELQPCLLNFTRQRGAMGFFAPHRWTAANGGRTLHEISLNPDVLGLPIEETFSTLVHEMCHQWQQDCGTPCRPKYHDKQWAKKMEEVGLIPSSTGQPGGRKTGQRMNHYVAEGGPFARAVAEMPDDIRLPWLSHVAQPPKKPKAGNKRVRLSCPGCELHLWVEPYEDKPRIECGLCGEEFLTRRELKEWKAENEDGPEEVE